MRAVLKLVRGLKILSITASVPVIAQAAEFDSVHRPASVAIGDRLGRWIFMARGNLPTFNGSAGASRTAASLTTGSPRRFASATLPYTTVAEPISPRTLSVVRLLPVLFDGRHAGLVSSPA
jgi:hypothetical protein